MKRVVFVRQFVHLATILPSATDVGHALAELLVSDKSVVDNEVKLLLVIFLKRIRVGSPFLHIVVGNQKEIHCVLDKFLVLFCSVAQEVPARAVDDADIRI